jgi:catechol 2,3-dioxygenase-like lactoylglutathione lyase family enzyme
MTQSSMINRIDVISIPVADQTVAKRFYVEKLGFEVIRENPMGPDMTWVQLAPKGADTSVTLVTWFDTMPPGSLQGIVINTDNVENACADLVAKGVDMGELQTAPWGTFSTFTDPDSNGLILQQNAF